MNPFDSDLDAPSPFRDRQDAGRQLAKRLASKAYHQPVVLALPRGGAPVAYEIARELDAPLDVWVVRKVGLPWYPELGLGAVAEGGYLYLAPHMLAALRLCEEDLSDVIERERNEVERRVRLFRGSRPPPLLSGRTVILVDDGIATGGTVQAALRSIRAANPERIVLAVPVAAPDTLAELQPEVDEIVCRLAPDGMDAIGAWYADFAQVSNDDVVRLLQRSREPAVTESARAPS